MIQYEYRATDVERETLAELESWLNDYGEQGWEVVESNTTFGKTTDGMDEEGRVWIGHENCVRGFYLFKRQGPKRNKKEPGLYAGNMRIGRKLPPARQPMPSQEIRKGWGS